MTTRQPSTLHPFWGWMVVLLGIVILDQATKQVVAHSFYYGESLPVFWGFNLVYVHNLGAAFSFLADFGGAQRWLFSGIAAFVILFILNYLRRHTDQKTLSLGLTLIAAGALGNLIDRVFLGYVIDFLDFYYAQWHWPAFNVADISICLGAATLIVDELFLNKIKD